VGGGLRWGRVSVNVGVGVGGGEEVALQTHADAGRQAHALPSRPVPPVPPAQRATAGGGWIGMNIGIGIGISIGIVGAAGRRAAEDL